MRSTSTSPNAGEVDQVGVSDVMDIAGLILYDTDATPIRLKVLLDRLMSALSHDQVMHVLAAYGWAYDDFCRGYKLQVQTHDLYICSIALYSTLFAYSFIYPFAPKKQQHECTKSNENAN